jgi:predicted amidohydrolase YtcJ
MRTLLRGGRVLTPDGWSSDVLVEGDRIVAVVDGSEEDVDHVVELRGRLVTPAFVDAHVHLAATGFAMLGADLSSVASAEEALELLTAHAATTGLSVVLAHGWDDDRWAEPPTRRQLDRATGPRPA